MTTAKIERDADRRQTLASFDWQWSHLPDGDFMPGDPWFDENAAEVLAIELCAIAPQWFSGRSVLDAGCGQGRWTRAMLDLGAHVTAVDFSEEGLDRTRQLAGTNTPLETMRVDLLEPPTELMSRRFDFVFAFGVLHHTGDTWRALENVARLVGERGALFLYLYGEQSWSEEERRKIEGLRAVLAPLPFDQKTRELRRRFPRDDPHQMFDLLSPVINDRVSFDEVAERLRGHGFPDIAQTIQDTEIYLRASRPGFPRDAMLSPVGAGGRYRSEVERRFALRKGAAFEDELREALRDVPKRRPDPAILAMLREAPAGARILDASLPPDFVAGRPFDTNAGKPVQIVGTNTSIVTPGFTAEDPFDVVIFSGGALGACRFPGEMLLALWRRVKKGGRLVAVLPPITSQAHRTVLDKVLGRHDGVPEKLARLLRRYKEWTTGEGLAALGGAALVNPLEPRSAEHMLSGQGASSIEMRAGQRGQTILLARRAP
ncbi:MAG: class I SAM-dependent methyltransferase [Gemmatimonadaceae bacterium]